MTSISIDSAARRTTRWAWVPALYVGVVVATAVALRLLGKPQWFAPGYWASIPALFLIECVLLRQRFSGVRHPAIRYTAVVLAAAFLAALTAYVGTTLVFAVFGPLGWI